MTMSVACLHCSTKLKGRSDKKFCSSYCRSAYHYEINKQKESSTFQKIDRQLKINRKILKAYNKAGLATIRKEKLLEAGFDPGYFTHYWKNQKNQVYLFCYEYGFLDLQHKYVLITWQPYMERKGTS
ncbi:hypothetical protein [Aquimarina intermedia]|uniref:DUF2116 family Zn-ribbon domain-containing protein n=1 Tax=Aquimarina intermedia TaxID=350814 RepID=A0A5S5BSE3_9FLAO|nr:hypothetical protein [Aquimarina intermedia]TYP69979.1 hypothetical protein BD809_11544 [Aquimarina intermedia]